MIVSTGAIFAASQSQRAFGQSLSHGTAENDGTSATAPSVSVPSADITNASYTLGGGDKLRVIVYGEDDLGGEFVVDENGFVRLPLVGQVAAAGRTVLQFEEDVAAKLGAQYVRNPRVSVEVVISRPFYIIGEVNKPGGYPFVAGMSVLTAVALAGGYTYRANDSVVYIHQKGGSDEEKHPADDTTKIRPGDIIRVVERWF